MLGDRRFPCAYFTRSIGFHVRSIERAGFKIGDDVWRWIARLAEFYIDSAYKLEGEGKTLDADGMSSYLQELMEPVDCIDRG